MRRRPSPSRACRFLQEAAVRGGGVDGHDVSTACIAELA
jgi:hypothetical protein